MKRIKIILVVIAMALIVLACEGWNVTGGTVVTQMTKQAYEATAQYGADMLATQVAP